MELILTGDLIDASHAKQIGLVNEVFPAAELQTEFRLTPSELRRKARLSSADGQGGCRAAARTNLREGLDREADLFCLTFGSEDKAEGVRAFLEKRNRSSKADSAAVVPHERSSALL